MGNSVKITISLSEDLLQRTDELAKQEGKPRSNVFQDALRSYLRQREREEMIAGYQEMAELNRDLAEEDMAVGNEVWAKYDYVRGEIYLANLDPVRGHEQAGTRPVLVIQNDLGNAYSSTTIVAAITSRIQKRRSPLHVELPAHSTGLPKDSVALLEQIRTIDRTRLLHAMGVVPLNLMQQVDDALRKSLALEE